MAPFYSSDASHGGRALFHFQEGWISLGINGPLGIRAAPGKGEQKEGPVQSSEPLQRTPLLKAILIKGKVLEEKA